jgi:hypothetical protein
MFIEVLQEVNTYFFVFRLNPTHAAKTISDLLEALLSRRSGKIRVQDSVLVFLSPGYSLQIGPSIPNSAHEFKMRPGVFSFILGNLQEDVRDMGVARLFGGIGIIYVSVPSLRFSGKGGFQVLLGLTSFNVHFFLHFENSFWRWMGGGMGNNIK